MFTLLKIISESFRLALHELLSNKLRTFLSLLGITIGIFCIICVLSGVDSLAKNVRSSFNKLGNDVVYVKKFSWEDSFSKWWQYIKRPNPSLEDYKFLKKKSNYADDISYHAVLGSKTIKYQSRSAENVILIAYTSGFAEMFSLNFEKGRNLTQGELNAGAKKVVLGHNVAEAIFEKLEPVGKYVKLHGQRYQVIGVLEKSGEDVIKVADFDDCALIAINAGRSIANLKSKYIMDTSINIKAKQDVQLEDLKDEITGLLRAKHRLKPKQDEDFSINEMTMLTSLLDQVFAIMNLVGLFIGLFAMIVGMFSVANIMFVSVKERTPLIGIKKALGAQNYIILLEFLIESIILCILGGLMGLLIVYILAMVVTSVTGFSIFLSIKNIIIGVSISVFVGIVAGVIPAFVASKMDPVVAIRS